jgi:hypothetical protein
MGFRLATELLSGECYGVNIGSDDSETVRMVRSIAADLGATIQQLEQSDGKTKIVFAPAVKSWPNAHAPKP